MTLALIIGILTGLGLVIYKGIYFGPWIEVMTTIGTTMLVAIGICLFLRILASIGSFFVKALLILIFLALIFFGGRALWNSVMPDHPIGMPDALSHTINRIAPKQ